NTVPVVALNVLWHSWQMNRCSFCEWTPILPLPVWPLAGQCRLGQNVVVGSMTLLLAVRGNIATRSMSGPPFAVQLHRTTVWWGATPLDSFTENEKLQRFRPALREPKHTWESRDEYSKTTAAGAFHPVIKPSPGEREQLAGLSRFYGGRVWWRPS